MYLRCWQVVQLARMPGLRAFSYERIQINSGHDQQVGVVAAHVHGRL